MSDERWHEGVQWLVEGLHLVMLKRAVNAGRLSPETLPDEILLLEGAAVLRKESKS